MVTKRVFFLDAYVLQEYAKLRGKPHTWVVTEFTGDPVIIGVYSNLHKARVALKAHKRELKLTEDQVSTCYFVQDPDTSHLKCLQIAAEFLLGGFGTVAYPVRGVEWSFSVMETVGTRWVSEND